MAGQRKRVTLTTAQRASAAGTELLDLLVDITADGELSDEEVGRLGNWIADNDDALEIPGVAFLRELVVRIVDDCSIDHEERLDLAVAIERVMPKQQRLLAKDRRAQAEQARAPADEWGPAGEPATQPQLKFLRALGVEAQPGLTKDAASAQLDRLLASRSSVSNRQMMVLRFWDCTHVADQGRYGVSCWMDEFYAEDRDRPAAWEWWKEENGDCGRQDPPEKVPLGVGALYLARVKERLARQRT